MTEHNEQEYKPLVDAAEELGINPTTIYGYLHILGIKPTRFRGHRKVFLSRQDISRVETYKKTPWAVAV